MESLKGRKCCKVVVVFDLDYDTTRFDVMAHGPTTAGLGRVDVYLENCVVDDNGRGQLFDLFSPKAFLPADFIEAHREGRIVDGVPTGMTQKEHEEGLTVEARRVFCQNRLWRCACATGNYLYEYIEFDATSMDAARVIGSVRHSTENGYSAFDHISGASSHFMNDLQSAMRMVEHWAAKSRPVEARHE